MDWVVIWDFGATWVLFARQAEAADYHPRYAIHTQLHAEGYKDEVPPRQRAATIGAGWSPASDVADEALPPTEQERQCWAANRRAGTNFHSRPKRIGRGEPSGAALDACQLFEMTQAALAPAGGRALAQGSLLGYFQALGDHAPTITPPPTLFAQGKWDGGRYYAPFAYDAGRGIFHYTSGWREN